MTTKRVQFSEEIGYISLGENLSLEQGWWGEEELLASFHKDVKKAKQWRLVSSKKSSVEKRGMEFQLARDGSELVTMNANYIKSVVQRYKRLVLAGKSIGTSLDSVGVSLQRYSTEFTQENYDKARERGVQDQEVAFEIYGKKKRDSDAGTKRPSAAKRPSACVIRIKQVALRAISC